LTVGNFQRGGSGQIVVVAIVNVYVPCNNNDKLTLGNTIKRIRQSMNDIAWCVVGNFNAVKYTYKRKGLGIEVPNSSEMVYFNEFIENRQLLHIPVVERRYTWYSLLLRVGLIECLCLIYGWLFGQDQDNTFKVDRSLIIVLW